MSELNKSGFTKVFRTIFLTTPLTKNQLRNIIYDTTHSVVNNNLVLGQGKTNHTIPDDTLIFPPIPTYHLKTLDTNTDNLLEKETFDRSGNTVYDTQLISTSIRVNRFPTKSFKQDKNKLIRRRQIERESDIETSYSPVTKKRTDLIKFIYRDKTLQNGIGKLQIGTIEIGAMAPTSVKQKNGFSSKFSPFSFCVTISPKNVNKRAFSIYTDYKFKLGELYNVELVIESATSFCYYEDKISNFLFNKKLLLNPRFVDEVNKGTLKIDRHTYVKKTSLFYLNNSSFVSPTEEGTLVWEDVSEIATQNSLMIEQPNIDVEYFSLPCYVLKLYINGIQEKVATYDGKVWDRNKSAKDVGDIATMPGFKSDYMYVTLKNNEKKIGTFEDYVSNFSGTTGNENGEILIDIIPKDEIVPYIKVVREKIVESSNEALYYYSGIDFTKLDEIQCSPILKRGFETKKLNSKDIISLNNGVDFGLINIYKKGYEISDDKGPGRRPRI